MSRDPRGDDLNTSWPFHSLRDGKLDILLPPKEGELWSKLLCTLVFQLIKIRHKWFYTQCGFSIFYAISKATFAVIPNYPLKERTFSSRENENYHPFFLIYPIGWKVRIWSNEKNSCIPQVLGSCGFHWCIFHLCAVSKLSLNIWFMRFTPYLTE